MKRWEEIPRDWSIKQCMFLVWKTGLPINISKIIRNKKFYGGPYILL
jgi:hypothetical protein